MLPRPIAEYPYPLPEVVARLKCLSKDGPPNLSSEFFIDDKYFVYSYLL